jgi:methionine salvage enolase-phosphatase E1
MVKSLINKEEKPLHTEKMTDFMHEKSEYTQLMANLHNILQNNDLTNEQKVEEVQKMIKTDEDIKENHVLINN